MIRRSGHDGAQPAEGLVAVAGGRDLVAVGAQLVGEEDEQVRVVVDDQDPGRVGAADHAGEYREGSAEPVVPAATFGGVRVVRMSNVFVPECGPVRTGSPVGG